MTHQSKATDFLEFKPPLPLTTVSSSASLKLPPPPPQPATTPLSYLPPPTTSSSSFTKSKLSIDPNDVFNKSQINTAKKCLMDENKSPEDALSEIEMMSTTITAEDLARNKENMSAIKYMEDIQNVSSDEEEEDDDDDESSDVSESDDDLPPPSPPPPTPQPARKLQPKKKTTSSQLPPPQPTASFKKDDDALDIHCEDDLDEDFQHKKQTPSSVVVVKPSSSKSKSSSSSTSSSSSDKKESVKRDSKGKPYLVSKSDDSYRIVHKGCDASFADETRKNLKKRLDKEKQITL
ncbi:WASH complex subunit 3-like [Clytia hemisphaerica]|uniref:WASH complex subunit 3-like n=1 Tax=Clytia hemisphaerica TaxID=252671 RepID=UPI0034D5597E